MAFHCRITFLSSIVITLFSSCGPEPMFTTSNPIDNGTWASDDVVKFSMDISDTLAFHDFYLHASNGPDYVFSNLYVFLKVISPNEEPVGDTIEMVLANPAGKWIGHRPWYIMKQRWENTILFKRKIRFPMPGTYRFELKQGMRDEQLADLYSVGITVVKNK